jgi:hypothetical protein
MNCPGRRLALQLLDGVEYAAPGRNPVEVASL